MRSPATDGGCTPVRYLNEKTSCSWPDAKRSDLYRLRVEEGRSLKAIGALYGVDRETVRQQCLRWGIVPDSLARLAEWRALSDADLVRLYVHDRLSQEEIAARFGVCKRLVFRRLFALGVTGGRRGRLAWASLSDEALAALYWADHLTAGEIADRYGVTESAVLHRMERAGIPKREPGGKSHARFRERYNGGHAPSAAEIARLYHEEDLSLTEIARRFSLCPWTIYARARDAGIPKKDPAYHRHAPAWFNFEGADRSAMREAHLAAYREWLEGSSRLQAPSSKQEPGAWSLEPGASAGGRR